MNAHRRIQFSRAICLRSGRRLKGAIEAGGIMGDGTFPHLAIEQRGAVTLVRLDRPEKRNAINDALLDAIDRFFRAPPEGTRVVVLHGAGGHFCAGLDLSEHRHRDAFAVMLHSRAWHRAFEGVQMGGVPVVAALHGGVIGGGLELAASTHVRVAERSTFYALPEGQRGIFVGGGATVRVGRLIGESRMMEMMLTGRSYDAEDGLRLGFSHYLVDNGTALEKAIELAEKIAGNATLTNYAILNAVPRIADMSAADGLFTESLSAALVQTGPEAAERLQAFLEKRQGKVGPA
jgi:enoyl-CoA hydratase/carnithine racemase